LTIGRWAPTVSNSGPRQRRAWRQGLHRNLHLPKPESNRPRHSKFPGIGWVHPGENGETPPSTGAPEANSSSIGYEDPGDPEKPGWKKIRERRVGRPKLPGRISPKQFGLGTRGSLPERGFFGPHSGVTFVPHSKALRIRRGAKPRAGGKRNPGGQLLLIPPGRQRRGSTAAKEDEISNGGERQNQQERTTGEDNTRGERE